MKRQYLEDDKLFIFHGLAADKSGIGNAQLGFDGCSVLVAELFSLMLQMLSSSQNRLTVANVGLVRVNDFRTSMKLFIAPQPQAVPNTKRFFH
jgi:hypothetical protein